MGSMHGRKVRFHLCTYSPEGKTRLLCNTFDRDQICKKVLKCNFKPEVHGQHATTIKSHRWISRVLQQIMFRVEQLNAICVEKN